MVTSLRERILIIDDEPVEHRLSTISLSGHFVGIHASRRSGVTPSHRMLVAKYQNIDSVPSLVGFNSLFGFTALKVKLVSFVALGQTPSCPLGLS